MKNVLLLFLLIHVGSELSGQTTGETKVGTISYVTTQNIYVKFQSTENIAEGDTLFLKKGDTLLPVLTVKAVSSISCVCVPVSTVKLSVSDQVLTRPKIMTSKLKEEISAGIPLLPVTEKKDTVIYKKPKPKTRTQLISGRVSLSTYSNFSSEAANSFRIRYSFSMNLKNIGNSKLSAETYISFVYKLQEWKDLQYILSPLNYLFSGVPDIFDGVKIYSLALDYEFNKNNKIWLGRKINPRISNMGAIDGLQYELRLKSFTIGLVGGFRPDYLNYGFNADLFQFGGYVGHDYSNKNGSMQTTLAFVDQLNNGNTDRRFAYLQHTNALVKNLYFFGSVEIGLYKKTMNPPTDTIQKDTTYKKDYSPDLSNLYLSLRYRPVRQLSLSVSYSSRQNIIYYETYYALPDKNIVERLFEESALQGYTFQANYQPVKMLSIGLNAGYRDRKNDPRPSKNFYGYVTYSRIPGINVSATASVTLLETGYMSGNIYSLGISRDLINGKLYLGLNYRYVDYRFVSAESKMVQNMGEMNITWRILKKLSCSVNYEGTFEKSNIFNRVYINITQRF